MGGRRLIPRSTTQNHSQCPRATNGAMMFKIEDDGKVTGAGALTIAGVTSSADVDVTGAITATTTVTSAGMRSGS